ncbi:hypothetical protein N658DRAFT_495751 [Parathielavia hyrcaniae]|uniref:F-box domain-containing protein n=1 Tax=Parathielavia hyrcaniae TaxID=113614 RepID=A0AAN6Q1M4_9PEZI|nr:hypothetical protein N658DRAFT_495751 [Parathielavia hyrcaniae]
MNSPTSPTMRLPHLPTEIWIMILEQLPASFFQKDLRRLTLSRGWYDVTFPILYPRIEFTPRIISGLVHRRSKRLDKARDQLLETLRFVNIVLDGLGTPVLGRHRIRRPSPLPGYRQSHAAGPRQASPATRTATAKSLNTTANLARFSAMLLNSSELREVRFAARWPNHDWPADPLPGNSYLSLRCIEPYLNVLAHVTTMDLDLRGTDVTADDGAVVHFCEYLRPLLLRLTTLRLRMRSICASALQPVSDPDRPVTLRELSLSLYMGRVSRENPKLNASKMCRVGNWREWKNPQDQVRRQMRQLVRSMAEPRRAEMLHLVSPGEVHVWNASTGLCARDGYEKPWRFPPHTEAYFQTTCFLRGEDRCEGGNEVAGPGGMWSCSEVSEESSEEERPDEPVEVARPASSSSSEVATEYGIGLYDEFEFP